MLEQLLRKKHNDVRRVVAKHPAYNIRPAAVGFAIPMLIILFFLVVLFVPLTALFAQDTLQVTPGSRIRVWRRAGPRKPLTGSVVSIDADSLILKLSASWRHPLMSARTRTIPLTSVEILQVSLGHVSNPSMLWKGVVIGFALGALVTVIDMDQQGRVIESKTTIIAGSLVGAGIGLVVGGILAIPRERWSAVPLSHLRMGMAPPWHRGLALSVSFGI